VVLGGAPASEPEPWDAGALREQLQQLQAGGLSASDAARELASRSGHSRRELYALLHNAAD
jgi:16S rRNA (cytidine1402-2'-O)-methyltransferase